MGGFGVCRVRAHASGDHMCVQAHVRVTARGSSGGRGGLWERGERWCACGQCAGTCPGRHAAQQQGPAVYPAGQGGVCCLQAGTAALRSEPFGEDVRLCLSPPHTPESPCPAQGGGAIGGERCSPCSFSTWSWPSLGRVLESGKAQDAPKSVCSVHLACSSPAALLKAVLSVCSPPLAL